MVNKINYCDITANMDRNPIITFFGCNGELWIDIKASVLSGSFPLKAKELKVLKQLIRRFH